MMPNNTINADGEIQNNVDDDYASKRFEFFVQDRNITREELFKVSERFEKTIFLISGGALGISMTFIKEIVSAPLYVPCLLYCAWVFLAASLVSCLWSLNYSLKANHKKVEILDETQRQQQNKSIGQLEQTNESSIPHGKVIDWLNWAAVICLTVGILSLIFFVVLNTSYNLPDTEPHLSDTQVIVSNVVEQNENYNNFP